MSSKAATLGSVNGRVVVITGANRGLGRALAHAFDKAGARLVLHARSAASLQAVVEHCTGDLRVVEGDLKDPSVARELAQQAEAHGGCALLILNAGMLGSMGPLAEASLSEFAEVLEVNVTAQVAIVQALLDGMKRRRRGVIVWLSSGLGRFGVPGYGAYCASKHAVEGLMKIVAEEHTADGIVSVAVAPGMVATDMLRAALGQEDVSEHQTPEETALAFVAMAESLSEEHSGGSLDIAPWLQ